MPLVAKARRKPPWQRVPDPRAAKPYAIAGKHWDALRRAYVVNVNRVASNPESIKRLVAAVQRKDVFAAVRVIPSYNRNDPAEGRAWHAMVEDLDKTYRKIVAESGQAAWAELGLPGSFSLQNPYSIRWIEAHAAKLVSDISRQARANIIQIVRNGFLDGFPPRDMATQIKAHIGLLDRESEAVARMYQRSIAQGVAPAKARDVARAYSERLLGQRAERIARTETIAAEAEGTQNSWLDATQQGYLPDSSDVQREWIGSSEENGACRICADLDGKKVGLKQRWSSRYIGQIDHPPAHPSCRCTMGLVFKED
jgi:hypothetical protein